MSNIYESLHQVEYGYDAISENLPMAFEDEMVATEKEVDENEAFPSRKLPGKVLIVENNRELLELLVSLFAPYYQVLEATNGKEAFKLAKDKLSDLIVSDLVLPELSGI